MNDTLTKYAALGRIKFFELWALGAPHLVPALVNVTSLQGSASQIHVVANSHNSINSQFHPGFLASLADMAATLATQAAEPDVATWSRAGLAITYQAPVHNEIWLQGDASLVNWAQPGSYAVNVLGLDANAQTVFTATLTVQVP